MTKANARSWYSWASDPHGPDGGVTEGITPFFADRVVPLQREGGGRPVFVFAAGHNETKALAVEARIVRHVGREHPFWGVRRDDPHFARTRAVGLPAMAAEHVAQIRAIQETGPYLFYGNCVGGYFAWETARQLLAAGDEIAGILFYEVPLRSDINTPPTSRRRRESDNYRPEPLPIDLTLLMTEAWHGRDWSTPWRHVVQGTVETLLVPAADQTDVARRDEWIARHIRDWIAKAEVRIRRA